LGYVLLSEKNPAGAAMMFKEAARLNPAWPEAYYMWGVAESMAGQGESARAPLEKFLSLDPESPLAWQVTRMLSQR
jgi:Flp pilus assembly protein TadD